MKGSLGIVLYTLKETIRKGTLMAYFIIGTIIILIFAFGIKASSDDSSMITFFGSTMPARATHGPSIVDFLLIQVYNGASGSIMLLGLFGTAGLIPSLLEKGTIELFLSKPVSRTNLFLSRCGGALSGIMLNILYFTLGIWFVFGIKLGVWHWGFLASSLLTSYVFLCFFSVAALFGVATQSAGVAIIVAFFVNMASGMLDVRELTLFKIWDNAVYHRALDVLYYVLPQMSAMTKSTATLIAKLSIPSSARLANMPENFTILPFLYSTLSAGAMYLLAVLYFKKKDY
jgi:ABC-type transport system involved in multi-copper enzyme maturation permease subunit